jgi:hypothetical protein
MRKRFDPKHRKELILNAALVVASRPGGWLSLTRQLIAKEAECSEGLVSCYLGDMKSIRRLIMRDAVKHERLNIIVQSVAANDGYVKNFKPSFKSKALIALLEK